MFKQNTNTSSTLFMMGQSNGVSQQSVKQSQIQNFSKLLKKLQSQNVNIDELRVLKAEHSYLEKLRNQRQKIEELRQKYMECETSLAKSQEQSKRQAMLIQQYETTIDVLKEELEGEREIRMQLEGTISVKYEMEKQKANRKMAEQQREIEELRKVIKSKDLCIMQLQQQAQQRITQIKEQFNEARRKLMLQVQQKLQAQVQDKSQIQKQVTQLRNLVTRQNKALKQQNSKYEELSQSQQKLVQQLQRCHEQVTNLTITCEEYEQKLEQLQTTNERLMQQLGSMSENAQNTGQLQQLRKQMADMAKGEIERIEFIVNEFE